MIEFNTGSVVLVMHYVFTTMVKACVTATQLSNQLACPKPIGSKLDGLQVNEGSTVLPQMRKETREDPIYLQ